MGNGKVIVPALKFFIEPVEDYDSDEEENTSAAVKNLKVKMRSMHSKKTKGRLHQWEKKIRKAKKGKKGKYKGKALPAIEQIYDPLTFADKLFRKSKTSNQSFDIRLMMLNLVARVIKVHKLILVNFYPFIQKYLDSKQTSINYIFVILIQSCHELIHPDIISPILQTIVNKFVCEYNPATTICIGLNTVREICLRCPLGMNQQILRDISNFKSFKDKGVMMAAKSIINLFRTVHPKLLHRKDRGKEGQVNLKERVPNQYGQTEVATRVEGAHLLEKAQRLEEEENSEDQKDDNSSVENDDQCVLPTNQTSPTHQQSDSEELIEENVNEESEEDNQIDDEEDNQPEDEEENDHNSQNSSLEDDDNSSDSEIYHHSQDEKWNQSDQDLLETTNKSLISFFHNYLFNS